ncbi:MAG: hypothetical protein OXH66_14325 [Gemmatimonadetes bacterium]|nr:hypothetical protein [Gemmatimonadota bacterium]
MANPTINTIKKEGRDTREAVAGDLAGVERRIRQELREVTGIRAVTLLWGAVIFLLGFATAFIAL